MFDIKNFHKYFIGRKFTLVTDDIPLIRILGPKQSIPMLAAASLQRWSLILSVYEYDIEYTTGKVNIEACLLSRLPLPVAVVDPNQEGFPLDYCADLQVSTEEVAKETQSDPVLRKAYQLTLQG